jgi:hypothetical protein
MVNQPTVGGHEADEATGLTTLGGWRSFVAPTPVAPDLPAAGRLRALTPAERAEYDEARLAHHAQLGIVVTPVIRKVITEGRRLTYLNRHAVSGRCGLILSGPARTGKTTALTQMARTLEILHRERYPHRYSDIPAIYITAPPAATPRMIATEFARFLGLPVIRRANITDIIEAVCGVCIDARTHVIGVDEIHNIALHTTNGAGASDMLKYFAERIPATFVYAGIDVERAGLLSGPRGEQIAGRFAAVRTGPFPRTEDWTKLVSALEGSLRLHKHRPGSLAGLSDYLHQRTGGMIGSLLRLIRCAAIQAVLDGTERITRTVLAQIELDIAAQDAALAKVKAA